MSAEPRCPQPGDPDYDPPCFATSLMHVAAFGGFYEIGTTIIPPKKKTRSSRWKDGAVVFSRMR